jgi:hypothetical protein
MHQSLVTDSSQAKNGNKVCLIMLRSNKSTASGRVGVGGASDAGRFASCAWCQALIF